MSITQPAIRTVFYDNVAYTGGWYRANNSATNTNYVTIDCTSGSAYAIRYVPKESKPQELTVPDDEEI